MNAKSFIANLLSTKRASPLLAGLAPEVCNQMRYHPPSRELTPL
jgi:hypothetical protein